MRKPGRQSPLPFCTLILQCCDERTRPGQAVSLRRVSLSGQTTNRRNETARSLPAERCRLERSVLILPIVKFYLYHGGLDVRQIGGLRKTRPKNQTTRIKCRKVESNQAGGAVEVEITAAMERQAVGRTVFDGAEQSTNRLAFEGFATHSDISGGEGRIFGIANLLDSGRQ